MAWSYRQDRADEVYHEGGGPAIISGEQTPEIPTGEMLADKKLREKKKPVEGVVTQFQEHPGQDVPRVIEGEGETKKDKEIVKAAKEREKAADEDEPTHKEFLANERSRIQVEERERMRQEELEKDREKIRKEVQDELKKDTKKPVAHSHEAGKK